MYFSPFICLKQSHKLIKIPRIIIQEYNPLYKALLFLMIFRNFNFNKWYKIKSQATHSIILLVACNIRGKNRVFFYLVHKCFCFIPSLNSSGVCWCGTYWVSHFRCLRVCYFLPRIWCSRFYYFGRFAEV